MNRKEIVNEIVKLNADRMDYTYAIEQNKNSIDIIDRRIAELEARMNSRVFEFADSIEDKNYHTTISGECRNYAYFKNIDSANRYARMMHTLRDIWRWQAENDVPIKWESDYNKSTEKYIISYDHHTNRFEALSSKCDQKIFDAYFSSKEIAEQCIQMFIVRLQGIIEYWR